MRVKFSDDVADGARGFLVLGAGRKAQFAHRVDDAPLHGLESVADVRQCAIEDHVHRVIQVGPLGEYLE